VNDYARCALAGLVWVESILTRGDLEALRREVVGARNEVLAGAAVDLRDRLRAAWGSSALVRLIFRWTADSMNSWCA
jgi:hypothetical protein